MVAHRAARCRAVLAVDGHRAGDHRVALPALPRRPRAQMAAGRRIALLRRDAAALRRLVPVGGGRAGGRHVQRGLAAHRQPGSARYPQYSGTTIAVLVASGTVGGMLFPPLTGFVIAQPRPRRPAGDGQAVRAAYARGMERRENRAQPGTGAGGGSGVRRGFGI